MKIYQLTGYPTTAAVRKCVSYYLIELLGKKKYSPSALKIVKYGTAGYTFGHPNPTGHYKIAYILLHPAWDLKPKQLAFSFHMSTAPGCCGILSVFHMFTTPCRPVDKVVVNKLLRYLALSLGAGLLTYNTTDHQASLNQILPSLGFRRIGKSFVNHNTYRHIIQWRRIIKQL